MHVRTWSFYAFILVFQLSGGIYLSALPDMEGETALMSGGPAHGGAVLLPGHLHGLPRPLPA